MHAPAHGDFFSQKSIIIFRYLLLYIFGDRHIKDPELIKNPSTHRFYEFKGIRDHLRTKKNTQTHTQLHIYLCRYFCAFIQLNAKVPFNLFAFQFACAEMTECDDKRH